MFDSVRSPLSLFLLLAMSLFLSGIAMPDTAWADDDDHYEQDDDDDDDRKKKKKRNKNKIKGNIEELGTNVCGCGSDLQEEHCNKTTEAIAEHVGARWQCEIVGEEQVRDTGSSL